MYHANFKRKGYLALQFTMCVIIVILQYFTKIHASKHFNVPTNVIILDTRSQMYANLYSVMKRDKNA